MKAKELMKRVKEKVDIYIYNKYESKMDIDELAHCKKLDFILACKLWDFAYKHSK